jgi:serine/threonine protein kinase
MRSIGSYEILREIDHGGMGTVYMARQRGLGRLVALKELNGNDANDPELTKRFARESRLGGSLNHPNIVTVHDYIEEGETAYIAMEYVSGGSLRSRVGKLSLAQIAGVLDGLLAGLAAVEPIVHRDLKPENLLITADGRVKIVDFGIAKTDQAVSVTSIVTSIGTTLGTAAYMAPEQALSGEIGSWTDLYSVGVIAYEQFVGAVPFHDSRSSTELLLRRVNEPSPLVIESRPDVDPALSEWVDRLLVRDHIKRTRSASAAREELEEIVLELLGARWRRDAPLPTSTAADNGELSPSRPASPPGKPLSQPEIESGFYSYGHMPSAIEGQLPALSPRSSVEGSPGPTAESPPPVENADDRPSASASVQVDRRRISSASYSRRLLLYALTAVLTASAGIAIAFMGSSTGAPVHSVSLSANATASRASQTASATLSEALARLNAVRAQVGAQLDRASTADAQAAAAQRLGRAHEQAAGAVHSIVFGPSERTASIAITGALTRIAGGYATMASAARDENRQRFDSGRTTVTIATSSLLDELAQFRRRS